MQFTEFTEIIKLSVSPVVLISGIGLLLLSMTNRLGRVIDRVRALTDESLRLEDDERKKLVSHQIDFLYRRARLLRSALIFLSLSILLTGVIIILLFATLLWGMALTAVATTCFVLCVGSLILAMALFITDLGVTLEALKYQIKRVD